MNRKSGRTVSVSTLKDIADYIIRDAFYVDSLTESLRDTANDLTTETWGENNQTFTSEEATEIIQFVAPICTPFYNSLVDFWMLEWKKLDVLFNE